MSRDRGEWDGDLITFQRRIIVSIILGTDDAFLRGVEIRRVSWQIGVLVVRPSEEESCVLTRCDADFHAVSRAHQNSKGNNGDIPF